MPTDHVAFPVAGSSAAVVETPPRKESTMTWQLEYEQDMLGVFGVPSRQLVRGAGVEVWDSDDNRLLDFLSGIAVNALGHAHPTLVAAITQQAAELVHVSNLFASRPQLELAAMLKHIAGTGDAGKVFFCNSGTEANEAAFKLARKHGGDQRPRVLSLTNAFHGRTMGSLALTPKPSMQDPFRPLPSGVEHVEPTLDALRDTFDDRVAALFVEPIQGEAGVLPLDPDFLRGARELATEYGAFLIVDEVQTGIGRTGEWFGFQESGITPDAITLAKGLGGGVPIGALVTFEAASHTLQPGEHGSTFGGNPLATSVALAVLQEITQSELLLNVRQQSYWLATGLRGVPGVRDVRGRGLLLGVVLERPIAREVVAAGLDFGIIVNAPDEQTIRIAPPLIVSEANVLEFLAAFEATLTSFAS